MIAKKSLRLLGVTILAGVLVAGSASAFYTYEKENSGFEARGLLRLTGFYDINPDIEYLYGHDDDHGGGAVGRLLVDGWVGDSFAFQLNVFQLYRTASYNIGAFRKQSDTDRSPALEWRQSDTGNSQAYAAVDWLNVRFSRSIFDVTIGRQPINLATCYFFAPNDFFAPFSAQTFYRVYKSGVDSVRIETRLGDLTQLTIIGALGYEYDPASASGWRNNLDWEWSSALLKITTNLFDFEWSFLGGSAFGYKIIGGALRGELAKSLALLVEGHYSYPRFDNEEQIAELSVELEKRIKNDLTIWVTYFHHGAGSDSPGEYNVTRAGTYLGKRYAAAGLGYQLSPLLYWEALSMINLSDESYLISYNFTYSVSDETELSGGLSAPVGDSPEETKGGSEFGVFPASFYLEIRSYF